MLKIEAHETEQTILFAAAANLAYLRAWRRFLDGDGFDFCCHGLWTCNMEPNHVTLSQTLHADIRARKDIGLQGFNSCRMQRIFSRIIC